VNSAGPVRAELRESRRRPLGPRLCLAAALALGCGGAHSHGKLTNLSLARSANYRACSHRVPEEVCVRCHPERAASYQARGDWCAEHHVPESQCLKCHPELTFTPPAEPPPGADVRHIVQAGEALGALEPHLAEARVTVFDFYADWCPPCRTLDEHLYARLRQGATFAIRKVNVVDWDSAVAQEWLKEVPELPFVIVYGQDGRKVTSLVGLQLEALDAAIERGASAESAPGRHGGGEP
jgi:thiol-disulfide isomerase/thioredoxin